MKEQIKVYTTPDGDKVTLLKTSYADNNTLAVALRDESDGSILCVVTVNLSGSPYGDGKFQDDKHAFIDTNNCPWAPQWLVDNSIAKPDDRDIYGMSGYCTYPLFEFFI